MLAARHVVIEQQTQRVRRRSRRREEVVLTAQALEEGRKRIKLTTKNSRQKVTRTTYKSYRNSIHEWYNINRPQYCNDDGELVFEIIRNKCAASLDSLHEEANTFKDFLNARTHISKVKDDGTPARASVGTLMGFRSAFNYFVWTHEMDNATGPPYEWLACLKSYYAGLKNSKYTM